MYVFHLFSSLVYLFILFSPSICFHPHLSSICLFLIFHQFFYLSLTSFLSSSLRFYLCLSLSLLLSLSLFFLCRLLSFSLYLFFIHVFSFSLSFFVSSSFSHCLLSLSSSIYLSVCVSLSLSLSHFLSQYNTLSVSKCPNLTLVFFSNFLYFSSVDKGNSGCTFKCPWNCTIKLFTPVINSKWP